MLRLLSVCSPRPEAAVAEVPGGDLVEGVAAAPPLGAHWVQQQLGLQQEVLQ